MRTLFILYSLVLLLLGAGCKNASEKTVQNNPAGINPALNNPDSFLTQIGPDARVEYVNTKHAYVVFKDGRDPSTGVYGKCMRKGRVTAYIIVEPIRNGSHIIAKIEQGLPKVGDLVVAAE